MSKLRLQTTSLACLALVVPLAAQKRRSLDDAIPATAHVVVTCGGLQAADRAWRSHGLHDVVKHVLHALPEKQHAEVMAKWRHEVRPRVRKFFAQHDLSPATLRSLLSGPHALVVGRATIASGVPTPSVAVIVDVHGRVESATRVIGRLSQALRGNRASESVLAGAKTMVVHVGQPGLDRVYLAIDEGRMLVSNSAGLFAECVKAGRGKGRRLGQLAAYRAGRKQLKGDALATVWINTEPLMAALRPFLPYEADAISKALGLGELRGIFGGAAVAGKQGTEVFHLGWRGDSRGLFRTAISRPASTKMARYCSPDTVAFAAARVDPSAFFRKAKDIFESLPAWMRKGALEHAGNHLNKADQVGEHLSVLTGDFALACTAPKALPIPEVTLFVGVRDAAKVTQHLTALMKKARGDKFRTQKFLDTDIHSIVVDIENGVGLAPCFACVDGTLMMSTHPRVLKATLRRADNNAASLQQSKAFASAQRLTKGSTSFLWIDTGALVKRFYGSPQLQTMLRGELIERGVNPKILPEADDLAAALGSIVVASRVDRDGFTVTSHSSMGDGTLLALVGHLVDAVLRDLIGRDI